MRSVTPFLQAACNCRLWLICLVVILCLNKIAVHCAAQQLHPLKYNNESLVVDLGVGLWAWPIPCDADQDGDFDLIVSCPDKPSNGVWLFENREGDTSVNKFPVFEPAVRLSPSVKYLMPSYVDDQVRVLSPGFEYLQFSKLGTGKRLELPLDSNWYEPRWKTDKGPRVRHRQWRYVDYNADSVLDLVVAVEDWSDYGWDDAWDAQGNWTRGPLHGFVFLFLNRGDNELPRYGQPVQLEAGGKPIDVFGCPSPNFADFDADGDLDLLCGEFLDSFTYFQNVGNASQPNYADGQPVLDDAGDVVKMELQMIVPVAFDWDRDGDSDLIVGDEDGRVALVENLGITEVREGIRFSQPKYFQQRAEDLKCGALATPFVCDWDADGDQDILSGNTAGFIEFFENLSGPGIKEPSWNRPVRLKVGDDVFRVMAGPNGSIQGPAEAKWGYTTICVADWDGDSKLDIVLNSIWGKVEWLRNVGETGRPELAGPYPVELVRDDFMRLKAAERHKPTWTWWEPNECNLVTQWRTTPCVVDWNSDGHNDLVMLDDEGFLAFYQGVVVDGRKAVMAPTRIFWGENLSTTDSQNKIKNAGRGLLRLNDTQAGGSGRRKLCIADWNGDGQMDLLVNSTNANLLQSLGSESGIYTFRDMGPLVETNIQGHTTSPTVADFDNNGQLDFIGGAEDGRFYYLRDR